MRQAIKKIMDSITDECVITSCGYISREVYHAKDRPRNFYLLGSMGSSLAVGCGLAYSRPDLHIIVIQGDGSALMGAGSMILSRHLNLPNLTHYILYNETYASTGGQKNCASSMIAHCTELVPCGSNSDAPRIPLTPIELKRRFVEAIRKQEK